MLQLPVEIWLHIAKFLPDDTLRGLLVINGLFFDLAMDIRYREVELYDVTPNALKILSQLRSYPSVARRVRSLKVQLDQLRRLGGAAVIPSSRTSDPSPTTPLKRLRSALLHPHLSLLNFRPPAKSPKDSCASFEVLLDELAGVFPTMSNVEAFHVDSWNLPKEHDLLRFFSAAWSGFGATLRRLSLGGNIEGFKVIKASQPVLPALTELHFEFTNNMNPPKPNSPEAIASDALTRTLLHDFVAPFVNGLSAHLEILKLWSWASIDLSSFFKSLATFPHLHTLSIWAAFNRSFTDDSSGLTQVLYRVTPTLKELMLRLNPTGSRLFDPESDLALCHWLTDTVNNNKQFSSGLRRLELYPSASDTGLNTLTTWISRSSRTLEQLNVRDRYLFVPEIARIASAFHPGARLTFLRLNVRELPATLFDLFATAFPTLKTLALRAADGQPPPEFVAEMRTRTYHDWNLYDITIWQGGNDLDRPKLLTVTCALKVVAQPHPCQQLPTFEDFGAAPSRYRQSTPPIKHPVSSVKAEDSCFDLQLLYQSTKYLPIHLLVFMASGVVNIRRDVDDKFYRYRMPILLTKIEGKGNGIKTVIPNMSDVARALSRPPTYTTKFFGCELGAQTSFDEKNDRYIVNGAHNAERLRELLDGFIDKFVLCKSCKNPETELIILKNGRNEYIIRDCKACGERTDIDMRHKLTTFILKNPPVKIKKGKNKNTGDAAGGVGGGGNDEEADQDANGAESDDELTRKIKAEAAELHDNAALANDDWSTDTSPEAVKQRVKALEGPMASVGLGGDDEGSDDDVNSPYALLGRWIEDTRDTQEDPKAFAVGIFKKAEDFGIEKKHRTVLVLVQALFTEDIVAEITKYGPLLVKMVTTEKHQKSLLGGLERFIGIIHPDLVPVVPKILMALYQMDILEEELVTQWGTHVSKKYVDKETSKRVRKASEPFLKWLEEADDDEEDEDE
ncbi:hypothetical protein C0991_009973 [Blastosporella zonata]|nr:hypothetical protein C0991_009973 [Blastosporella zonata]